MEEKGRIAKAAGLMSAATFISRVLGFMRDMVMAYFFGATALSDAFFVGFRIPNLLRELFAEGAMSAAVIPVLTARQREDPEAARRLVAVVMGFMLIVVGAVCTLGIIFSPTLVDLIAPGFKADPDKRETTILLTRIMFPFLLLVSLASVQMAALNSRRVFFIPALAPSMMNVSTVVLVGLFASTFFDPIVTAAVAVTVGGVLHYLIQVPACLKEGYGLRPTVDFRSPDLKKILLLILPVTLGIAVSQVNILISNILASYLPGGSVTYLFYSMRLIHFPIGMFGVAMGMAVLPSLATHAHEGRMDLLKEDFSFALRLILFISVPSMVGLMALGMPIVSTLFFRGRFDLAATTGTAEALFYYSLGIWAIVSVKVMASTFYSMNDTRTPMLAAIVAMGANIASGVLLMDSMQHSGLALANSISGLTNFLLLAWLLRRRLGPMGAHRIARSFGRVLLASLAMAVLCIYVGRMGLWSQAGQTGAKSLYLALTLAASVALYLASCRVLRSEELAYMLELIGRKFKKQTT